MKPMAISESIRALKRGQLEQVAQYRDGLRREPRLEWLFFELTNRCNLACGHCGSSCTGEGLELSLEDVRAVLESARPLRPMVCLTGGEPMLHPRFFEIARLVKDSGFYWGMTTNATLIDAAAAERLREVGLSTVSVSLDGMEAAHDALRHRKGAWRKALAGIKHLQDAGFEPQVTTVVHMGNFDELEPLYGLLRELGITSWRPINVEPIGRACEADGMLLTPERFRQLLDFIRAKRFDRDCPMEVTFGCSHYLGVEAERMVRDHYFMCGAGITVASVRSNGDICACLDIENRPELVQGNIHSDDFADVWLRRFDAFRRDRTARSGQCAACPERYVCGGDSAHTWNYDAEEPLLCGWKMIGAAGGYSDCDVAESIVKLDR